VKIDESETEPGTASFNPGSVCNLACVTCGPGASTRWQRELGLSITLGNPKKLNQTIIDRVQQLNRIVLGGGEPMLNLSTETLLQHLNADQWASVHFNGTVLPKQSFLDKSSQIKNIKYVFSLDGIGERFEYLRWPAQWDQVVQNVLWLFENAPDNVGFGVNVTISQLNQYYQDEIVDWVNQTIPHNKQGNPTYISYNQSNMTLSQTYLDDLDKKRNLDWRKTFPLATDSIL
jgi:MoaA/NifB/PqqE/SkfB family radical SAM enzyme